MKYLSMDFIRENMILTLLLVFVFVVFLFFLIKLLGAIVGDKRFVFIDVYIKTTENGQNKSVQVKKDTRMGQYYFPGKKLGISNNVWEEATGEYKTQLENSEDKDDIYIDLQKFKTAQ